MSEKFSFSRILSDLNDHVQLDPFYIHNLTSNPIMYVVDIKSVYSETAIISNRSMDTVARFFETTRNKNHRAPDIVLAGPEFASSVFRAALDYLWITFQARQARWHNKIVSFERKTLLYETCAKE